MTPTAAIYGNSQAGGTGAIVQDALQARGWQVTRWFQNGAKAGTIVAKAIANLPGPGVVVLFAGDATAEQMAVVKKAAGPGRVVWVANPPATKIANLPLARSVFGKHITDAEYWLTSGVAKDREVDAKRAKQAAYGLNIAFVDPRALAYPAQPDGIHATGSTAKAWAGLVVDAVEGRGGSPWGVLALAAGVAAVTKALRLW
jgi:hypothetical protein